MSVLRNCPIPKDDRLFQDYHDNEWGMPVTNDNRIFEKVCLEGFQSGLSWQTILHRRENFRDAFANFEINEVAAFGNSDIEKLLNNDGIIRNRRKISSAVNNAHKALELQEEFGSLADFFWAFEPAHTARPKLVTTQWLKDNPKTAESEQLSKALKSRGWSFVGPTTMYALMQALGLVNDHIDTCDSRSKVEKARERLIRPKTR